LKYYFYWFYVYRFEDLKVWRYYISSLLDFFIFTLLNIFNWYPGKQEIVSSLTSLYSRLGWGCNIFPACPFGNSLFKHIISKLGWGENWGRINKAVLLHDFDFPQSDCGIETQKRGKFYGTTLFLLWKSWAHNFFFLVFFFDLFMGWDDDQ